MDEETKKTLLALLEEHSRYLNFIIRDKLGVAPDKIRSVAFIGDAMFENELRVNREAFEEEYQEYLKFAVVEEAKRIVKK